MKNPASLPQLDAKIDARGSGVATVRIKGMMCTHCEGHVKRALESLPDVLEAMPDFHTGTATVTLSGTLDKAAVKAAVKSAGYKVTGFEKPT